MRRLINIITSAMIVLIVAISCEKESEPILSLSSPSSISFTKDGGSQIVSFRCNRDWMISTSDSWINISTSSGSANEKGENNVSITCENNTTFEDRNCSIVISSEGMTATIFVTQDKSVGLEVSTPFFEVSSKSQTITIVTQSNVSYSVYIDETCKSWISQVETKGLNESKLFLNIAKNEGYDREGKIYLKYENLLQETIVIKQKCHTITFEDSKFESYCVENFDFDGDREISIAEADSVKIIDCSERRIKYINEIGLFKNLESLNCSYNQMHNLDLSGCTALKYLDCSSNYQLSDLNIKDCTALEYLNFFDTKILDINLSSCHNLLELCCDNTSIKTLDLSNNSKLEKLYCSCCWSLTNLDVSTCPSLKRISCGFTYLKNFDLSACKSLKHLSCAAENVDVHGLTMLEELKCENLINLNTNGCIALENIECYGSYTSLDFSELANLKRVKLLCVNLSELNINGCVSLEELECYTGRLTTLDISSCSLLKRLDCSNNSLTDIDVSNCPHLEEIYISNNQFSNLNLSSCTSLTCLNCSNNLLTNLDVSGWSKLEYLSCENNNINNLNISGCSALKTLHCNNNDLTSINLSDCSLLQRVHCNRNLITDLDFNGKKHLRDIRCSSNKLNSLTVEGCDSLNNIECYNNNLTNLDLEGRSELGVLMCYGNNLSNINVKGCSALTDLHGDSNPITNLNIEGCISLVWLYCLYNKLTSMDVSHCMELTRLHCNSNTLKELWLKQGQVIEDLRFNNQTTTIRYKD